MRVIQERDGSNTPTVSYTRGNDLSVSLEGAGGIGGLLARSSGYSSGNWTSHADYYADGNGNITSLIDTNQSIVASYRYDPFGNIISKSGTLADANIYRFSSKEVHVTSGMYYYGFRFYDPNLQRWINRDPIEELGGWNLFAYTGNDSVNGIDLMGLCDWRMEEGHGGNHIQNGNLRWDAETLRPIPHKGVTPDPLTPSQLEELRQAGILDKARKMFPNGAVARAAQEVGVTGKLLKLSSTLAKPLIKAAGRLALPLAVVGAVQDAKAIGQTASMAAQAASAKAEQLQSTADMQKKVNERLNSADDLSDDEITHYMSLRCPIPH